ncbi:pyridoxal-phosphate dependent enzyme [Endozoicomonas acroporae]|uniref:pyridoxal-phosphate dependent enzyme n=1 Tax=Endozoicomonas acroporae TaxID=1701104 RepID=UPI003D7B10D3
MTIHNNIIDTIGRTPIVKLNSIAPNNIDIYVKLESFNPGGSVKDRLAHSVILDAEERGAKERRHYN